jgi:hypothetical protein
VHKGVFSKDEAHEVHDVWDQYDADGNGSMDGHEMAHMIIQQGWLDGADCPHKTVEQALAAVDTNKVILSTWPLSSKPTTKLTSIQANHQADFQPTCDLRIFPSPATRRAPRPPGRAFSIP